ncbi:2'-5' RNA ligase superfamily protein [compost metagenome]
MKKIFTLAYPCLSAPDAGFIEDFRRQHDGQHPLTKAHFTIAFGCAGIDEQAYLKHVEEVARSLGPISFACRYAMLGADTAQAYAYLVPDEGYSGLSRLHDAAYRQLLAPTLRLDIPYVPHITIGSSSNRALMKSLCDELNRGNIDIRGSVDHLTVAALENGVLTDLTSSALVG